MRLRTTNSLPGHQLNPDRRRSGTVIASRHVQEQGRGSLEPGLRCRPPRRRWFIPMLIERRTLLQASLIASLGDHHVDTGGGVLDSGTASGTVGVARHSSVHGLECAVEARIRLVAFPNPLAHPHIRGMMLWLTCVPVVLAGGQGQQPTQQHPTARRIQSELSSLFPFFPLPSPSLSSGHCKLMMPHDHLRLVAMAMLIATIQASSFDDGVIKATGTDRELLELISYSRRSLGETPASASAGQADALIQTMPMLYSGTQDGLLEGPVRPAVASVLSAASQLSTS